LASGPKKEPESPSFKLLPAKPQCTHTISERVCTRPPIWRSIQLATRWTNRGSRTQSFQTQIVKHQTLFSTLLFHSGRATQDNKTRVSVNSSKGAGPPLAWPAKRGSRGPSQDIDFICQSRRTFRRSGQ
jgi:hypothetical protein